MAKYEFTNSYGAPPPPVEPFIIEAANEDEAWEKFDQQILEPIIDAFTCEEVDE
jgi:hypothetical protein